MHRTLRAALNEAVRRSHLARNPVLLAKAPKLDADEVEPYDVPEIQRLLEAAARRRNGARWALALALGLRQGEALGLNLGRREPGQGHNPGPPLPAAAEVQARLRRHLRQDPGPLPRRESTRAPAGLVKSKAGRRTIGLPPQLIALLRAHRTEQEQERAFARQLWLGEGWVFATLTGQPISPRTDYTEWKRLLGDAGLREGRLHDARHTAATVLVVLRQPTPTVMSLMGWSSESMAARYQHVTDALRSQVASQVGDLIWNPSVPGTGDQPEVMLMIRRGTLAEVLDATQHCLASHENPAGPAPDLTAAIADLRAVLAHTPAIPETRNETKTETRRLPQQ